MTKAANLADEVAAIRDYLTAAQDVLKSGYMPDITSLEGHVAKMCETIQQAVPAVQKQYAQELSSLVSQLAKLEGEMKDFHESRMKAAAGHA